MKKNKSVKFVFFLLSLLFFATGCFPYKKLKEGETRLVKNEIKVEAPPANPVHNMEGGLARSYKQSPNKGWFHFDTRLHYRVSEAKDSTKFKRWVRKAIAEAPAIYNKDLAAKTAQNMSYYLQNKGFRYAEVRDTSYTIGKKTTAQYIVKPGEQYTIDSVFYNCKDSVILRIIRELSVDTYLKRGKPVDKGLFDREARRLTSILQNMGYAYFETNFIKPRGLPKGNLVNVYYDVLVPPEKGFHQKYTIGKVFVNPYFVKRGALVRRYDTVNVETVDFLFEQDKTKKIKPSSILRSVYLRPGQVYKEEDFTRTVQHLGELAIIKNLNIIPHIDKEDESKINFEILLYPQKRMSIGGDLEVNNSNYNGFQSVRTNLFGVSTSLGFKNRNLFKNAASLNTRLQLGFELNVSKDRPQLLYSRNIRLSNDIYFPRYVDPLRFGRMFRAIGGKFGRKTYAQFKERAKTRLSLDVENISLFNYYESSSVNANFGYDLQIPNQRFQLNQVGINLTTVDKFDGFLRLERNNKYLQRSFVDQLFTGVLFRDFTYTYQGKTSDKGNAIFFRGYTELSGAEIFFANKLSNAITKKDETFQSIRDIEYAQYLRLEADLRWYHTFNSKQSFAARINSGVAFHYGFSDQVPYVKQFFIGGPNSVRAWRIRELGPGSHQDTSEESAVFFQSGDFILEMSAEYRFNIIKLWGNTIKGSFFVDGGNVWTLKYDEDRKGSQLQWKSKIDPSDPNNTIGENFLKQIAIGGGAGIRLDFSYFIFRLDGALKFRTPYAVDGSYWVKRDWGSLKLKDFNYNLAIGYPF